MLRTPTPTAAPAGTRRSGAAVRPAKRLRPGPGTRRAAAAVALCLGVAGVLLGLLAGPSPAARAADAAPAPDPPTLLEAAFGTPCEDTPESPLALAAPFDDQYERFVQARCAAAAGRLDEAAAGFRAGLDDDAPMASLWRWALLEALVLSGDHDGALRELETLLTDEPGRELTARARELVSLLALDPALAPEPRRADYLIAYLEHVTPKVEDYPLAHRLWELAGQEPDSPLGGSLALLMWRIPPDEATAKHWAAYLAKRPKAPQPTGADRLARAERLFAQGSYSLLASELDDPDLSVEDPAYAKALGRLYFRALIRGKQLHRAAVQVNTGSVMRRFAFDERQQLIWAARIQLRRRRIGPAMKYLEELERIAPKDAELPPLFLEMLKYNAGRHDAVTVMHWLERLATEFPTAPETSDAYWQVIWSAIERRAYDEALPLLERAIKAMAPFHPVDQARLVYWRGRLLMRLGQKDAGEALWKELEERWPYGYYTELAQWMRSGAQFSLSNGTDGAVPDGGPGPAPEIKALWQDERFADAIWLLAVGEPDLAAERLRGAFSARLSPQAVREAGALFRYMRRYHLQQRLVDNFELGTLRNSKVERSDLWLRAYPRPHWDVVRKVAEEHHVDPYFVFAIMREESRFFTSASSTAGARGLMQLMPSTARMVAKRNGLDFDEDRLHSPAFSIALGALYLKRVLGRFDDNPLYAAAAYNAGPGNVRRWLRRDGRVPPDEFVERIPFGETQRYVKRVFLSYMVYTKLYR